MRGPVDVLGKEWIIMGRTKNDMTQIFLKGKNELVEVGLGCPTRINCSVGINNEDRRKYEIGRLEAILKEDIRPDMFMDLSVGVFERPFYKEIQDRFDCPVGVVPSYLFPVNTVVSKIDALDILKRLADDGLSFFTIHLSAKIGLYRRAQEIRKIPMTSRGGGIVLLQQSLSGRENIWESCLSGLIDIAKEYGITISLGSAFRPAGIVDACDEVHLAETEEQLRMSRLLQGEGVQVMVENVGHISLDKLDSHCDTMRQFACPIMPLGPIPTDCAVEMDHIAASIGAAVMGFRGCAQILNCITKGEHSSPFFTIEETLEAIRTAKLAAHIIDVSLGINKEEDIRKYELRAKAKSCIIDEDEDCTRCSRFCPLRMKA